MSLTLQTKLLISYWLKYYFQAYTNEFLWPLCCVSKKKTQQNCKWKSLKRNESWGSTFYNTRTHRQHVKMTRLVKTHRILIARKFLVSIKSLRLPKRRKEKKRIRKVLTITQNLEVSMCERKLLIKSWAIEYASGVYETRVKNRIYSKCCKQLNTKQNVTTSVLGLIIAVELCFC